MTISLCEICLGPTPADGDCPCSDTLTPLDIAIANVITRYHNTKAPGDRLKNLARRYKALYDAIDDLEYEWQQTPDTETAEH